MKELETLPLGNQVELSASNSEWSLLVPVEPAQFVSKHWSHLDLGKDEQRLTSRRRLHHLPIQYLPCRCTVQLWIAETRPRRVRLESESKVFNYIE